MEDYNVKDNSLKIKSVVLIDRMLVTLNRLKIDRIIDATLCSSIFYLISELENIKLLIDENPRFDWVTVQNEVDRMFGLDSSLTGVNLQLDWENNSTNRGFIKGQIVKLK